ncbi:MAG: C40 family peptidase [Dehalococcoidia bacterium]|nr:C40 family peptidase [Dehalococcoidia bacterium]
MAAFRRALAGMIIGMVVAFLIFPNPAKAENPQVGDQVSVQGTDGTGVRMRSGIWAREVRNLPEGTVGTVIDEASDPDGSAWYEVQVGDQDGWVYGTYLQQISEDEMDRRDATNRGGIRSTAADLALQYVGYPYVWGGNSPGAGFDCSGFVNYVFKTMGTTIPRDYWGMMSLGVPVAKDQLLPGDLLFFVNTYTTGLSHVGIYVGNGEFVHAIDERSGVQISSLWTSYYIPRYYAARRIQ